MSDFSQTTTSSFPNQNILFNSASGLTGQELQKNQLAIQGQQIDLSNANQAQVGQAAAGLLSAYPDEASRAAAYPRVVGMLQAQGFAKNAPPTYPGEGVLRSLVNQSIPAKDLYSSGVLTPPGLTDALARASAPPPGYGGATAPGTTTGTGVATTPSATIETPAFNNATAVRDGLIKRGMDPDTATAFAANALHESVANPATGRGDNGNSAGLFQWAGPRLQAYTQTYGHSPDGEPLDQQLDFVMKELGGSESDAAAKIAQAQGPAAKAAAVSQYYLRPKDMVPEMQRRSATALQLQQQIGGGATTAAAAPATAQPGQPVPTQVASNTPMVSTAPPGSTAAPGGSAQPAAPAAAQAQPGQPQPAPAPAATAQPGATPLPGTGVNSQQFQTALWKTQQAALLETQFPNSPAAKAKAAELRAEAALYMQADSVITLPNGIQVKALSGQQVDAAKPAEMWVQQPNGTLRNPNTGDVKSAPTPAEVWVKQPDGTYINQATGKPESAVTPAEMWVKQPDGTFLNINTGKPMALPPGRLQSTPGGVVIQSQPGGGARVVYTTSPENVTAQAQAQAAGTAAGQTAGKLPGQLADLGRSAGQAIGNIDYGMSQIQKAKEGGINTGYFAPWLSTVGAIAKSIGGDTGAQLLGINPAAVGNVQTAQKTLAVVSGAILQQVLGPDSQVTDAKIQHFIHAQPGIETDPAALDRVLNWARSQFVYEREMAAQGMKDAKDTGTLPPGWQAKYFAEHDFAPVYNPTIGEMQQPDGTPPPRQAPATLTTAPINPAARTTGTVYSTPKGPMKWTGTGWLPVQ